MAGQGPGLADQARHLRLDVISMTIGCQSLALGAKSSSEIYSQDSQLSAPPKDCAHSHERNHSRLFRNLQVN